jgi:hypothetical protein
VAGRVAYLLPLDHILFAICEPSRADAVEQNGMLTRLANVRADWFDPDKPAVADRDNDWLIEIYDGRFVGLVTGGDEEALIFAELRNAQTRLIAWFPLHQCIGTGTDGSLVAKWQHPHHRADRIDPRFLKYKFEQHDSPDDPQCIAADAAVRSPRVKTSVNASLVIRTALRRYLGIESEEPAVGEPT